jgi:large subunit ribosomal protein L10
MSKELKRLIAGEYLAELEGRDSMVFIDYSGISAEDVHDLRNHLRGQEPSVRMRVVQNNIFGKVLEQLGADPTRFFEVATGQTAVLFTSEGEVGAKTAYTAVTAWSKKHDKKPEVVGGMIESAIDDAEGAKRYKDLKSRDEMISIIIGSLIGVAGKLSSQLTGPGARVASQIKKIAEKEEGGGE